jgi:hypothetical protein
VTQGINLDGGGSTTMAMQGAPGGLLNVPSDGGERLVGNNLAIFASPVPEAGMTTAMLLFISGAACSRPRRRAA